MKLQLRDKRPPGDWIETFVKASPFLDLCPAEEQSVYLSKSDEFNSLVANKRTLVTSLEESVKYDDAASEETERSCVKAWATAVFERAGAAAAARGAAAAAGTGSDANLGQAVAPLVCFATLVYSIAGEAEKRHTRLVGFLAAEAIAAAAATLATQGDAHPGPFWDPSSSEIVADNEATKESELSDVFCIAVLARCAAVLATRGGIFEPWIGGPDPPSRLVASLLEVTMVPMKFIRAAAKAAPAHLSAETRAIWQCGFEAAALFMVIGEWVNCWPGTKGYETYDDDESSGEEQESDSEGTGAPASKSQLAIFFAAYLGAFGKFQDIDFEQYSWGAELWKRAVGIAFNAHDAGPLEPHPVSVTMIPGLMYFLKGAVPPPERYSSPTNGPCLPTDVLSLRGLAYILEVNKEIHLEQLRGLLGEAFDSEFVDCVVYDIESTTAAALLALARTSFLDLHASGLNGESGLLNQLFYQVEYSWEQLKEAVVTPAEEGETEQSYYLGGDYLYMARLRYALTALARWTSHVDSEFYGDDHRAVTAERGLYVLVDVLGYFAETKPGSFMSEYMLQSADSREVRESLVTVLGPMCLVLQNLQAVLPLVVLDANSDLKNAVVYAIKISKFFEYYYQGKGSTAQTLQPEVAEFLAAIHRSTLGLVACVLEGSHYFGERWGTDEYNTRAKTLTEILAEHDFQMYDIARILKLVNSSPIPTANQYLHRYFRFAKADGAGTIVKRPGAGFPFTVVPLFSSSVALVSLLLRRHERGFLESGQGTPQNVVLKDLVNRAIQAAVGPEYGMPRYDRYRKAVPLICLVDAILHRSQSTHDDFPSTLMDVLHRFMTAIANLRVLHHVFGGYAPSKVIAIDQNELIGLGNDLDGEGLNEACAILLERGITLVMKCIGREIDGAADRARYYTKMDELDSLTRKMDAIDTEVQGLLVHLKWEIQEESVEDLVEEQTERIVQTLPATWAAHRQTVAEELERTRGELERARQAAEEAANAAAEALMRELEGETTEEIDHVADEKRRLKRQRQKEKQRAAKEGDRALREEEEAERAARKAEKERLKAEEERQEADRQAQREQAAAKRAVAKAAQEAAAAAAAEADREREMAEKERKLMEKREKKKAKKRAEKLAARGAQAEAQQPEIAASAEQQRENEKLAARGGQAEAQQPKIAASADQQRENVVPIEQQSENTACAEQQTQGAGPRPAVAAAIAAAMAIEQQADRNAPRPAVAAAIAAAAAREAAMRQPLGSLPQHQQQQQAPPPPASHSNDLDHLLGVLLPSGVANQENRAPSTAATAQPVPKSPAKLPGALGPLARDPLRWASLVAAISCPLSGNVFDEPVLLTDGQTYEKEAAERLGAAAAAGARPNFTMRKLVRELRDMGCAI